MESINSNKSHCKETLSTGRNSLALCGLGGPVNNCYAAPSFSCASSSKVVHHISKKQKREDYVGMDRSLQAFQAKLNGKGPGWTEEEDRVLLETFNNLDRDQRAVQREEWWIEATAEVNNAINAIASLNTIDLAEPKEVGDVGARLMRLKLYHSKVNPLFYLCWWLLVWLIGWVRVSFFV